MTLRQPPQEEREYVEQLRSASAAQLELARAFQRLAFAGTSRILEPGFLPAPLYLKQAMAVTAHRTLGAELVNAIAAVAAR